MIDSVPFLTVIYSKSFVSPLDILYHLVYFLIPMKTLHSFHIIDIGVVAIVVVISGEAVIVVVGNLGGGQGFY